MALICAGIVSSYSVSLGYGQHFYDITPANFLKMPLPAAIGGTFAIISAVWSKTSFAITLLRLLRNTDTWTKAIVWCIIISMNVAMGLSALFIWIACMPIEKLWNPFIQGTCYPLDGLVNYNIFSAGEYFGRDAWKVGGC